MGNLKEDSTAATADGLEDESYGQLQLYQTVPLYVDNLYPYTGKQPFHSVPSLEHPSGTRLPAEDEHERLARHLEGNIKASLCTLQSQPSTCIQWRILADRHTLELRTLRWVDDGERSDSEASIMTSWRFSPEILDNIVVADTADGSVSISACGKDGVIYTLRFDSPWDIASARDAVACTSWYRVGHAQEPVVFGGSGRTLAVACGDASVVWLHRRSDGSVAERVCAAGAASIIPRVAAFLKLRRSQQGGGSGGGSGGSEARPLSVDVADAGDAMVGATIGRDRRLRLWTGGGQCAFDEAQPQLDAAGAVIPDDPHVPAPLLDAGALVRVQRIGDGTHVSVLAYVPDDRAPYLALLVADAAGGRLAGVRTVLRRACRAANGASARMADDRLVDARVAQRSGAWTLWALWEREQAAVLTYTHLRLDESLAAAGHAAFGERWFAALPPPAALLPAAEAPALALLDARIRAADAGLAAADVSRGFLDHVMHPGRFDRGVVRHAAQLYAAAAGRELAGAGAGAGAGLRRRVAGVVGGLARGGAETRAAFLRRVYAAWARFAAMCARLQRAANAPTALALCAATQMVCVVGRSVLAPLQLAAEPECLYALTRCDSAAAAAAALLDAPARSLRAYPVVAQAGRSVAGLLAAAAAAGRALGPARVAALGDDLARDACGEALVALEARAAELYALHCAPLTTRDRVRAKRLLGRCADPAAALRLVLHALAQPAASAADAGADGAHAAAGALSASATMAGVFAAAFGVAGEARFAVARDVAALLVVAAGCPGLLSGAGDAAVAGALAASRRVVGLYAVPRWLAAQATGADASAEGDAGCRTPALDDADADQAAVDGFLRKFSVLNIARPLPPADGCDEQNEAEGVSEAAAAAAAAAGAETLFAYSLVHDTLARSSNAGSGGSGMLRVGECAGGFPAMVADGLAQVLGEVNSGGGGGGVEFAARVERTQPAELADALLRLLPRTSAASYLAGRASLRMPDHAAAAELFASAGVAYAQTGEGLRDAVDLQLVLPRAVLEEGHAWAYYAHVAEMFAAGGGYAHAARFARLALQVLDAQHEGEDDEAKALAEAGRRAAAERRQTLWFRVFHAELAGGAYEQAYLAVMAQPDATVQTDCLRHLVAALCERPAGVAVLCRLPWPGLQEEVERTLLFKARNSDLLLAAPAAAPNYYRILYAFHVYRGGHRNAASAMYQYAARLAALMPVSGDVAEMLAARGRALLACISGLRLVDGQDAWVVHGRSASASASASASLAAGEGDGEGDGAGERRKRRRVEIGRYDATSSASAAASSSAGVAQEIDIVGLADVRREYALCVARLELGAEFPELLARNLLFEPEDALALHVKRARYDRALALARQFDLPVEPVFAAMARMCLGMSMRSDGEGYYCAPPGFWLIPEVPSVGSAAERAWRLLQCYLDGEEPVGAAGAAGGAGAASGLMQQLPLRMLVAECVLGADGCCVLAPWLADGLLRCCPQDLVRMCLRLGCVTEAAEFLLRHVRAVTLRVSGNSALTTAPSSSSSSSSRVLWLPYGLVDRTVGILDDSVARFELAVEKIRGAQGEEEEEVEEQGGALLKSYVDRLEGLVRLRGDLKAAVGRYMELAARDVGEPAALANPPAAAAVGSIEVN